MDLHDVKYVFTILGCAWGPVRHLYAITKDNDVLHTEYFTSVKDAHPEFIFKLKKDLDFTEHYNNYGFDAPDCTMYQVINGELHKLYQVGMYDNTPAVDVILKLHRQLRQSLDKNETTPKKKRKRSFLFWKKSN